MTDDELRALLASNPDAGWRAFIDQYTPMIIGLIHRAGLDDRDEVMDVYVAMCERLSANGYERLRKQDGARGSIGGWLAVMTRTAVVDWIRSRKGRRRLFDAIKQLDAFDQRVFEQYYWDQRAPAEIADRERVPLANVFNALERIASRLTDRHRAELLSLAARAARPEPLDEAATIPDTRLDPEAESRIAQLNTILEASIRQLTSEDAAIVRLKFVEGLTNPTIERALGIRGLTAARLQEILTRLRAAIESRGVAAHDVAVAQGGA